MLSTSVSFSVSLDDLNEAMIRLSIRDIDNLITKIVAQSHDGCTNHCAVCYTQHRRVKDWCGVMIASGNYHPLQCLVLIYSIGLKQPSVEDRLS